MGQGKAAPPALGSQQAFQDHDEYSGRGQPSRKAMSQDTGAVGWQKEEREWGYIRARYFVDSILLSPGHNTEQQIFLFATFQTMQSESQRS